MYYQLIDYLEGREVRIEALKINRNRRRALRQRAQYFILPDSHSNSRYLLFIKATRAKSIYIVKDEVPRFLHTAHEDYGYHTASLTLDFLIGRVY